MEYEVIVGPEPKLTEQELLNGWIKRLYLDSITNRKEYFYPIVERIFQEKFKTILNPKKYLVACMNTYSNVVEEGSNNFEPMFVVFRKDIKEKDNRIKLITPIDDPYYLHSVDKTKDLIKHTLEQPICLNLDDGNIYFTKDIDIDLAQGLRPIPIQS